jgi:chemotaxis protein MotB
MSMFPLPSRLLRVAAGLALAGASLGGCASQQSYDQLLDANRSLMERNNELQRSNQELTSENELLQRDRAAKEAALAELERINGDLRGRLESAGISLKDLEARMAGIGFVALDPETDKALQALAAQYPDLIKYDAARGMLRFASDLTFNSGSDAVLEPAKQSLAALAKILTNSAAGQYDVMIVGHTDAQRISSGTAQRHPTNIHLSAHRAIAVRGFLAGAGVAPQKMFVAGWGEFRPAVANAANGNTPANRRVEVYLTKPTGGAAEMAPATAPATGTAAPAREKAPARQPDVTK